ncbi:MAG: TrkH family potassium uptake protein [Anaeroplasmataceae bacterium]
MKEAGIGATRLQIIRYIGQFMMMVGGICLIPLIMLIFYSYEYKQAIYFLIPGLSSILIGFIINFILRKIEPCRLRRNQDAVLVVLIWIISVFICSLPYKLSGDYTMSQAIFESMSGFSTTGLSVTNVDSASHIFLFYRSTTLVIGGIGLVLVFTSALSDAHGLRLYTAEGHNDRLMANLARSGRLILLIYFGYILLGFIAYLICGMKPFDAINYAMAAVSTGGFATHSESVYYFNSIPIEIITMVLMLLGSTNFVIHTFLLRGKIKKVWHHCETKLLFALILIFVPLMTLCLVLKTTMCFSSSFRIAVFQFISAVTGTGFQTVADFKNGLPTNFIALMIVAMLIGGGTGSTSGAIKQYRICLVMKSMCWNIKSTVDSKNVITPRYINKYDQRVLVTDDDIHQNNVYIMLYLFLFIIGSIIFTCCGYPLEDSMFTFASALGTVGLSSGVDFITASPVILWTSIFGMFFGRLEIIVIFIAFSRLKKEVSF